jgi:hypothetical protein
MDPVIAAFAFGVLTGASGICALWVRGLVKMRERRIVLYREIVQEKRST